MEGPANVSLKEYAATQHGGCWVCGIPERDEINEAIKAGIALGVIRRWLTGVRGYPDGEATDNKLRNHKRNGHYER